MFLQTDCLPICAQLDANDEHPWGNIPRFLCCHVRLDENYGILVWIHVFVSEWCHGGEVAPLTV
jgi:hypothetical protein